MGCRRRAGRDRRRAHPSDGREQPYQRSRDDTFSFRPSSDLPPRALPESILTFRSGIPRGWLGRCPSPLASDQRYNLSRHLRPPRPTTGRPCSGPILGYLSCSPIEIPSQWLRSTRPDGSRIGSGRVAARAESSEMPNPGRTRWPRSSPATPARCPRRRPLHGALRRSRGGHDGGQRGDVSGGLPVEPGLDHQQSHAGLGRIPNPADSMRRDGRRARCEGNPPRGSRLVDDLEAGRFLAGRPRCHQDPLAASPKR